MKSDEKCNLNFNNILANRAGGLFFTLLFSWSCNAVDKEASQQCATCYNLLCEEEVNVRNFYHNHKHWETHLHIACCALLELSLFSSRVYIFYWHITDGDDISFLLICRMSLAVSHGEGVTVITITSNPKSKWPILCQILGSLCHSPVCAVSQQVKAKMMGIYMALGVSYTWKQLMAEIKLHVFCPWCFWAVCRFRQSELTDFL